MNGVPIRGLTLHDANQMILTASGGLSLSVIENKASECTHIHCSVIISMCVLGLSDSIDSCRYHDRT